MNTRRLAVEYRSISSIRFDPQNPRIHTKKQVRQISNSIKAFGFNVPVLINASGQLVAGHGRFLAAQQLGIAEIPTLSLEHLNPEQTRAFMIADNKISENADWNEALLGEQLKSLSVLDLDFSLETTGFEMSQIDLLIEGPVPVTKGSTDPTDALPKSTGLPPITALGDVWILNGHRVRCGDSQHEEHYKALMQCRKARMVFADPPYNDPIDGYVTNFGKVQHPEFLMGSGEMSPQEFATFLKTVLGRLAFNSEDGALHFICMDWRHSMELLSAADEMYSTLKNICVWEKSRAGQGSLYRSQHEFVFVFKKGTATHRNNIQLGQYGRYRTNVWKYSSPALSPKSGDEDPLAGIHPTIKPVSLVADAILDCTARGDIVLDPFLGSGTTLIAAERTGRTCYGMELDPRYVDVIVRRWQSFTGLHAVHESSGRLFSEIEVKAND